MPSNTELNAGSGGDNITTKQRSHDGDTTLQQVVSIAGVTGTEDSYTYADINGSTANGLEVDVTRVQGTVTVDGSGVTQPVSGTVTANLGTTDNAVLDNIDSNTDFGQVTGGGTEATALRVTVANDSTGVISVDDNGGSLTVDGTVTANLSATDNAVLDTIETNTDYGTVTGNGTASGALRVTIASDSTGVNGTSAVDTAAGGTDEGAIMLAVRDDSLTTLTPADGDYTTLRVNSTGALHVTGGGGGTEYTVDAAAPAAPTGTASLMERDDALSTLSEVAGDWVQQRCNDQGAMWTAIDGTVTVDGSGVTQPVSGTVTANLSATDNAVLDSIDTAVNGTLTVSGTVTANAGTGTMTVDLGANNDVQGAVAHDAAAANNPMLTAARATNNVEGVAQVANNDTSYIASDLNGVLLTRPHTTPEEHISERVTNTNGTSTAFTNFAAGGAGVHNYVCDVTITNTSGTDAYVDLRDGTGGAVIWTLPAPANSGATHSFSLPLKGAANTALAFDVSAAITTMIISVNGYQAQG